MPPLSPVPPTATTPAGSTRSALAVLAAIALVTAVALITPNPASSQQAPAVSIAPPDGPLYVDGPLTFTGTCPVDLGSDDVFLALSFGDTGRSFTGTRDGTTWTASTGPIGGTERQFVSLSLNCSGEGPFDDRTFELLAPSVDLELTVGTVPGECATTSTIEVTSGTDVYWCYTATNNSGSTYNGHRLSDDVDLVILDEDTRYDLGPGESIDTVTLGVEITDTITTATVFRIGSWRLSSCTGAECTRVASDLAEGQAVLVAADDTTTTTEADPPVVEPTTTTEADPPVAEDPPSIAPAPTPAPAPAAPAPAAASATGGTPAPAAGARPVTAMPTYTG